MLHPAWTGISYGIYITEKEDFLMAATEPIRDKKQLQQLAEYWMKRDNLRNYTMIVLGVCTALRISDLLRLSWEDVYDFECGDFRTHITVVEKKTGKQKIIALNHNAVNALCLYFPRRRGYYIFDNNRQENKAISRVQAWRIIRTTARAIGLAGHCIAPHSMRKSMGYHAWKAGVLPVLLMDIYNHSSFEVTRRYLGISQDDKDRVYLNLTLF